MNDSLTVVVATVISSTFSSFVTWFFSRRKYSSEVNSSEIENVKEAINIYKQMAMDLKVELAETKQQLRDVTQRLIEIERNRSGWKVKR